MATVVTGTCILSLKCTTNVCPVDAIHADDEMAYIDPARCEDCYECLDVCPMDAIIKAEDLPEKKKKFIQINADFFKK
jgi:Fe-S-cluster-containing hydrogenase component 2